MPFMDWLTNRIWEFRKAANEESFISEKNGSWTTGSDGMDEKECSHFILDQDGNILSQQRVIGNGLTS